MVTLDWSLKLLAMVRVGWLSDDWLESWGACHSKLPASEPGCTCSASLGCSNSWLEIVIFGVDTLWDRSRCFLELEVGVESPLFDFLLSTLGCRAVNFPLSGETELSEPEEAWVLGPSGISMLSTRNLEIFFNSLRNLRTLSRCSIDLDIKIYGVKKCESKF